MSLERQQQQESGDSGDQVIEPAGFKHGEVQRFVQRREQEDQQRAVKWQRED
jgi:hypothetical protein